MKDEIEDDCMEDIVNGIHFYKENKSNKIWWVDNLGVIGSIEFSFDKKTIFNFFQDVPEKLTKEQLKILKKESSLYEELK